jgi:hypothetical protein
MASPTKTALRDKYPEVPRTAWTKEELCVSLGCSVSFLETAEREGWGPTMIDAGGPRIPEEARVEWMAVLAKRAAAKAKQRKLKREAKQREREAAQQQADQAGDGDGVAKLKRHRRARAEENVSS